MSERPPRGPSEALPGGDSASHPFVPQPGEPHAWEGEAVRDALAARVAALVPGSQLVSVTALGADSGSGHADDKHLGYGQPLRLVVATPDGRHQALVFHLNKADGFGHDRRADRAAQAVLAYDTMGQVPHHVRPLDVGVIGPGPGLTSLAGSGEFYVITEWAEGRPYAELLRAVAERGQATGSDVELACALARAAWDIHRGPVRVDRQVAYARAWRDLVGSGEGIAGLVDGYPLEVPQASPARLLAIEQACLHWRHRFRLRAERLTPTHGDFHPFNIVIGPAGEVRLLDASRGSVGDPADDVSCLAINFLFFGLGASRPRWAVGLGRLWDAFWETYLSLAGDAVLDAAAPFFAWRALVLCNPRWYPHLAPADRDRLLRFAERALARGAFRVEDGKEAMAP
jgi:hypothetical protein